LDGGAVVIRGQPRNGPPPERVLALTNIDAPRLGISTFSTLIKVMVL